MKTSKRSRMIVADICLYGTSFTGAGYLGVRFPHGQTFGTGEPVKHRTFTEAIWHAQYDLRAMNTPNGLVRVFDSGGERMAIIGLNEACIYGGLTWQAAPVYTVTL